jgi:hypothetical protein
MLRFILRAEKRECMTVVKTSKLMLNMHIVWHIKVQYTWTVMVQNLFQHKLLVRKLKPTHFHWSFISGTLLPATKSP